MKALYQFYWDCGRSGSVEGLFIADTAQVEAAIGSEVHFGEILGKHSDIYGTLEKHDLTIKSEDQDLIEKLEGMVGSTICGYNPLDYIEESDEEEEWDEEE